MGSVNANVRAASSGALLHLAAIPSVLEQLSQNNDLVVLLLSLLCRSVEGSKGGSQGNSLRGSASVAVANRSFDADTAARGGGDAGALASFAFALGGLAPAGMDPSSPQELQMRAEQEAEQEVVVQMHAAG